LRDEKDGSRKKRIGGLRKEKKKKERKDNNTKNRLREEAESEEVKGQIFNIAHSGKRMKGRTGSFTRLSDNRITN
jgi:hypothetical protein